MAQAEWDLGWIAMVLGIIQRAAYDGFNLCSRRRVSDLCSEVTDPARRIADALHGFGIEVWFDQSELRGGDEWDAKIKRQIRGA